MSKNFVNNSWKTFLPEVYFWADKVKFETVTSISAGQTYVVPVKIDAEQNQKKMILSDALPADVSSELLKLWESSGWLAKAAALQFTVKSTQYLLVPLAQIKTTDVQLGRQFGLDTSKAIKDFSIKSLAFCKAANLQDTDIFDGLCMGLYDPGLFKGARIDGQGAAKKLEGMPECVSFLGWTTDEKTRTAAREMAKATAFTRMLQDAPPNWLTSIRFGDIAAEISKDLGLKCTLLGRTELEEIGAGSFLSVAAGTSIDPRLIAVEIKGQNTKKTIALVGKGLTFDSGGISLKPGLGMGEMKYDMSGGAAVLGAAHYMAKVKPACNVVCIIGAVENMPGPHATRPGDIVVAMNGKSIDIQNTDAEGRLVLADLLCYAIETYKPEAIVDVATLTGAVLHALGHVGAAVMSNNQAFADTVLKVSKSVGEPFWQLPLWAEFEKEVKGEWSDFVNIAKPNVQAGTIMGGAFLAEFVGKTAWAHLDVAGTSWQCKATGFPQSGGSSFALRTLSEICMQG